jgi:hypothetical protein
MEKRTVLKTLSAWLAALALPAQATQTLSPKLAKSKAEWKQLLPANAYDVLFEHGTERAGTSHLNAEKRPGTYVCAACHLPLFDAAHKIRKWYGLAELLSVPAQCTGYVHRLQADLPAYRVPLRALRRTPGPCV